MTRIPLAAEQAGGLPALTDDDRRRYARQTILPGVGEAGQRRLRAARVLVIGAGGLGSPVIEYLAAAGVGVLGIVDDDVVEESNLQRQIVHGVDTLGLPKVDSAAQAVARINPTVRVEPYPVRLTADNAVDLFTRYDLIIDGADNFATRYLVADAAELTGRPVVWGSILRFDGQASVFWPGHGPTYRDVFPEPPEPGAVPSCTVGGVFGVLPGMIGTVMAGEAVKLVTGVGEPLLGRLLVLDAARGVWRTLTVSADPDRRPVERLADDYEVVCGTPGGAQGTAVTVERLAGMLAERDAGRRALTVVDVREPAEHAAGHIPGAVNVPLSGVLDGSAALPAGPLALVCRTGVRSARALEALRARGRADALQVIGGTLAWARRIDPTLTVV